MKRKPASTKAIVLATAICVELFGKHCVRPEDVERVAAVIESTRSEQEGQ